MKVFEQLYNDVALLHHCRLDNVMEAGNLVFHALQAIATLPDTQLRNEAMQHLRQARSQAVHVRTVILLESELEALLPYKKMLADLEAGLHKAMQAEEKMIEAKDLSQLAA